MGIESLVPFGLQTDTAQLADVGNVPRGSACGCICPSCKTPLVARHGDKIEWHFAHRSQNVHEKTRKACDFSFAVSVRLMIRQLSVNGLKFRTPGFEQSVSVYSDISYQSKEFTCVITEESTLNLTGVEVGAHFSKCVVDVLGYVNNVPFVIYVTYKDRSVPGELVSPSPVRCGVVELNVNAVPFMFKQEKGGQYLEVLRRYIEDSTEGKSWVYHPREKNLRQAIQAEAKAWLSKQKPRRQPGLARRHDYPPRVSFAEKSKDSPSQPLAPVVGSYTCVLCKNTWTGTSRICENCDTHLYTTESG